MKQILISILLSISSFAIASEDTTFTVDRKATCDKFENVAKVLVKEFGETVLWQGKLNNQEYEAMLFINPATETWTLVLRNIDIACIAESGKNFIAAPILKNLKK